MVITVAHAEESEIEASLIKKIFPPDPPGGSRFKNDKIKITKLAQGLPVGGEIEQLDDGTLLSAFKNRTPVTES